MNHETDQQETREKLDQSERERSEANIRSIERSHVSKTELLPDHETIDRVGRPITIRSWECGDRLYTRAYDTDRISVPETVDRGQAGRLNAQVEHPYNQTSPRVCINDIETESAYRNAGTGGRMLDQCEQFAERHGASEIYGRITDAESRQFWESQAHNGWQVTENGNHVEVHKYLQIGKHYVRSQ